MSEDGDEDAAGPPGDPAEGDPPVADDGGSGPDGPDDGTPVGDPEDGTPADEPDGETSAEGPGTEAAGPEEPGSEEEDPKESGSEEEDPKESGSGEEDPKDPGPGRTESGDGKTGSDDADAEGTGSDEVDTEGRPEDAPPADASSDDDPYLARLRRITDSRVGLAVVAITALALIGRLILLGQRTAHWDEGRVAFWTLRYAETGFFEYRPVVHGPFLFQVNEFLFSFVGSNDFVARLPVAVVGGLLPGSAWLFRERLKGAETVALAGLLAINPLLVYYSRFMRNDVLVAAFMLFALGFVVRAYDSRNGWYAVPAGLTLALGFTAKENAIVYLVCWFGAAALLMDHRLMDSVRGARARVTGSSIREGVVRGIRSELLRFGAVAVFLALNPLVAFFLVDALPALPVLGVPPGIYVAAVAFGAYLGTLRGSNLWHYVGALAFLVLVVDASLGLTHLQTMFGYTLFWLLAAAMVADERLFTPPAAADSLRGRFPPMLAAYLLTFATLVFFYAPRSPDPNALGLWNAMTSPGMLPDLVEEALLGSADEMWGHWIEGASAGFDVYLDRLDKMVATMINSAGLVFLFAGLGFVYDRWSGGGPRDLVALGGYWGFVSVLGYPYATDIWAPWIAVHAVVPLAIPAAVGLAGVYGLARGAFDSDDVVTGALVTALLFALVAPAAITAVDVAYVNSASHERVITDLTGDEQRQRQYMLQWAQPSNELKGTLGTVRKVARSHEGTDVLFFGTRSPGSDSGGHFYVPDEDRCLQRPPVHVPSDTCLVEGLSWHSRLPLPWYLESYGATVRSTPPGTAAANLTDVPPVVIAFDWDAAELDAALPDRYEAHQHPFKLWYEDVVVFVDRTAVPGN